MTAPHVSTQAVLLRPWYSCTPEESSTETSNLKISYWTTEDMPSWWDVFPTTYQYGSKLWQMGKLWCLFLSVRWTLASLRRLVWVRRHGHFVGLLSMLPLRSSWTKAMTAQLTAGLWEYWSLSCLVEGTTAESIHGTCPNHVMTPHCCSVSLEGTCRCAIATRHYYMKYRNLSQF